MCGCGLQLRQYSTPLGYSNWKDFTELHIETYRATFLAKGSIVKTKIVPSSQPFHSQEWSISNFSCSLTKYTTSHSLENVAFHSLLIWEMIILPILTTSYIRYSLGRLGECTFWTWEWKGYRQHNTRVRIHKRRCLHIGYFTSCTITRTQLIISDAKFTNVPQKIAYMTFPMKRGNRKKLK